MRRGLTAGMLGFAIALLGAPAALASTATVSSGDTVRVSGGGDRNGITVVYTAAADSYTVIDSGSGITPGGPCATVHAHAVSCPGAGITRISVDTGNRDDSITLDRTTIPLGVRSDLEGGSGNDVINGARGPDEIRGEPGRDLLDGHEGSDELRGGRGTDTLLYLDRTTPLLVTVGQGNGDDGNELDLTGSVRDTVRGDIENVLGGSAGDVMIGDSSDELLAGNDGDDMLVGNNGKDALLGFNGNDSHFGGRGRDLIRGGPGDDRLLGGPDKDRLLGGPDDDFIWGKKGRDVMKGKAGIDRINAKDGTRDIKINCGPGPRKRERVKFDKRKDPKPKGC
jgi:Ca2+-binding RTX toxin-like protein